MVVDDSNIIRNKINRAVNNESTASRVRKGFELVAVASNGLEALTSCRLLMPDVVTMDLTMPEMDGIACIERLIKIKPDILILVVSALSDKATGIEALHKGASGFLLKPFSENELLDSLNELVAHL
jgi:two-component system chemotaxis response regulator CheY